MDCLVCHIIRNCISPSPRRTHSTLHIHHPCGDSCRGLILPNRQELQTHQHALAGMPYHLEWSHHTTQVPHTAHIDSFVSHFLSFCRHAIEAVNHMLQDICSTNHSFSGITVVFSGDFQQTLPVVTNGLQQDVIHSTLQSSHLWNNIHILHL